MYRKRRAFTLPEALITIAILASVILYFILAFGVSKYSVRLSKERLIVTDRLREEMENALASNYDAIDSLAGTQSVAVNDGSRDIAVTRTIGVATPDTGTYGYKEVYIKLEWTGGVAHNKTLKEEAVMYVTRM